VNDAETPVTFICEGNLALFIVPVEMLTASTYDAVWAVVMNAEAETHDADATIVWVT
jgi:hypothetical protein